MLVCLVFRRVCDDNGFIHISRDKRVFFVINGVVHFRIGLVQGGNVYEFIRPWHSELCWQECQLTFFFFHLFQRVRDHIRTVSKAVKKAVVFTAETGIRAEDKFTAVKIPYYFGFQRFEGELFILVSGIQVKGKGDPIGIHEKSHSHDGIGPVFLAFTILSHAVFRFDLEIVVGTVIVKDFWVARMNKVGILVKFFLNVIRFLRENRKGTVKILQGILRRLQQGLTVGKTAEFAGRGKYPCIDQIRKDSMEIVGKLMVVADISANVVQP